VAWSHRDSQIIEQGTDRRLILRKLTALYEEDSRFQTPARLKLLKDLELTVAFSKSNPGTPEALIDELTEYPGGIPVDGLEEDGAYAKLIALGFDAVPALIEHANDPRFTRGEWGMWQSYRVRIGHLACRILEDLAGDDLSVFEVNVEEVNREEALKWWGNARSIGEEGWLFEHSLPGGAESQLPWEVDHAVPQPEGAEEGFELLNETPIRALRAKYPSRLAALYQLVLWKKPIFQSAMLARAISRSALPRERKVALFEEGATSSKFYHRYPALVGLAGLNPAVFKKHLIRTLRWLPEDIAGHAYSDAPEQRLAELVRQSDDEDCWEALAFATRRVSVGLRFQLIYSATIGGYEELLPPGSEVLLRNQLLRYLAKFLDDRSIRGVAQYPKYFDSPSWADRGGHSSTQVRDYAAAELASRLGLKLPPDLKRRRTDFDRFLICAAMAMLADRQLRAIPEGHRS
jgi:hypothetical protein